MKQVLTLIAFIVSLFSYGQNVGIGTPTPTNAKLVVVGINGNSQAIFGDGLPGISLETNFPLVGFNNYYSNTRKYMSTGYAGALSMSTGTGDFLMRSFGTGVLGGIASTSSTLMTVSQTGNVGIGNATPTAPVSFSSTLGNKIDFYYNSPTSRYGLGLQGGLLQMYSDGAGSDIAFGYGSSTAFTENMRIRGNGFVGIGTYPAYPAFKLDVGGRMHLKADASSAGIWLANNANTADVSFVGQFTDTKFGVYGSGGWKFAIDNTDGTVYCGSSSLESEVLTNAVGYKLKVFGKIIGEEVRVQLKTVWPDYVFEKDYKKLSLPDLEKYLVQNKHLPNIPSASEIEKDGQQLGEIQRKMMEKVEELSLYIIDLNKRMEKLEKENSVLKTNNKLN